MMVSQKAAEAGGQDFTRKPVGAGTGAFKFVEWVKDDHITLERNPNYWKKDASGTQLPYLDQVTIRPIVDETVALTNVKTGDIDIGYVVPAKDYASVKAGKELVLQETTGLGYASISSMCRRSHSTRRSSARRSRGDRPRPDHEDGLLRRRQGPPTAQSRRRVGLR